MRYDQAQSWLGWPRPEQAFEPEGAGARVYAEFARKKIGGALALAFPGLSVRVGVLAADPASDSTEKPLAVVCDFARAARDEELDLAHALAWNFSRTALLVTLEPHRLIAWSCHQDPTLPEAQRRICEMPTPGEFEPTGTAQQRAVRDLLHWVSLITSRAQRDLPDKFPEGGRADALLLKNLRHVRRELLRMGLPKDFCHDLLARVIFTQFLFHRKDRDGEAFFSDRVMRRLCDEGILSKYHPSLASILTDKTDTYALFRWMDERFNGNLFPKKQDQRDSDSEDDGGDEAAWLAERSAVTAEHLQLLADLAGGSLDIAGQQFTLWPHYSFDTIPLDFVSSIYEEFLNEERHRDKAYYTPSHLVDYVLDAVLPWNDESWNLRVLDPCCGSGIFLVKAFQRLIHRWRLAHPDREPLASDLRPILENNLIGVDKNPEAVRVACFSLYLAMADAIEPKHYVTRESAKVFPLLRGTRLLATDFFDEQTPGIRSKEDAGRFDLVIGNAPWGDKSIMPQKDEAETDAEYKQRTKASPTKALLWAKAAGWPVANFDIGPVFLGKAGELVSKTGRVAMVQTASLLYWREGKAADLRRRLFTSFTFDEITNLSALRRDMFASAIGPSCVVVYGRERPQPDTILHYFTPKPVRVGPASKRNAQAPQGFAIEPQDVSTVTHDEAANHPWVWSALAVGSRRDLMLLGRVSRYPTIEKLEAAGELEKRKGVIDGNRKLHFPQHRDKPILSSPTFPDDVFLELDAERLPRWNDPRATSGDSVDFSAFKSPQLFIKQSYDAKLGRMRAVAVRSSPGSSETICREAYVSVHDLSPDEKYIRAACLSYNSELAVYFFALTSGSFPLYISKIAVGELVTLPLPPVAPDLSALTSFEDIDRETRKLFALTAADWDLIEDFLNYTLPDVLRKTPGPGRRPTHRMDREGQAEPELTSYAETFARVLKGTFGRDKAASATLYSEPDAERLPVRMVTIHLDAKGDARARAPVTIEPMEADGLLDQLAKLHAEQFNAKTRATGGSGLGFQRVAYFFHPSREPGMNLTIVKPDEVRYWTRSMAMRDADQLAAAIATAAAAAITAA